MSFLGGVGGFGRLGAGRKLGTAPAGPPDPPAGYIYLTDDDGSRLTDDDGAYLMEEI